MVSKTNAKLYLLEYNDFQYSVAKQNHNITYSKKSCSAWKEVGKYNTKKRKLTEAVSSMMEII